MRLPVFFTALFCGLAALAANTVMVGEGSPTLLIQQSFVNAYSRGQFMALTALPTTDVTPLGAGYVQEFPPKTGTAKYALIDPFVSPGPADTRQLFSDLYAYFTSVGLATAGFPVIDTTACPATSFGTCNYQLFANNYALYVYSFPPGLKFAIRDPFYTEWNAGGGVNGSFGPATGAETAVTSTSKVQGTSQAYATGVIYSYPTGTTPPTVYGVSGAFYAAFSSAGGFSVLGLPTSEAVTNSSTGLIRQTFEFGRIEQVPGGTPTPVFPISSIGIVLSNQGLALAQGATATVSAAVSDTQSNYVTGRTLTWSTSNGSVVAVQGNGYTATLTAVGPGSANIYVTGEGKTSPPLVVTVGGGGCCSVGQDAPTQAISQAFQTALTRNKIFALTASGPVLRAGTGYVQTLAASDGSGTVYAVAEADGSGTAYILSGSLYTAYLAAGGFSGPLGYPASDSLPGGAQKFSSGAALAGTPIRLVPARIATKWFQLGGATGSAGQPVFDAMAFSTFGGVSGLSQTFASGAIFATSEAYFSYGPILARYLALNGPAGVLGLPLSDIFGSPVQTQNFETGYIDLQPGAATAVEHFNPLHPALTATPATVVPGGKVHLAATGFAPGATLNITLTGQPPFSVTAPAGSFAWDIVLPPAAKPATVTVNAAVKGSADAASASYSITPAPALLPRLTLVSGDRQTGQPGATLPAPVSILLVDSTGSPLAGVPVVWAVSPGATVRGEPVTNVGGMATAMIRMPLSSGVAVGSVSAGGQAATFSALVAASALQNFPAFTQTGPASGLSAPLAALLRYYQNLGLLGAPNGLATPALLSQFLAASNGLFASESGNSIADPWLAARFAQAGLWLENPSPDNVHDLLSAGTPLLLVLNLTIDGAPGGSTAVDAIGIDANGAIVISDPNARYAQTSLAAYLNGFSAQGHAVSATLSAVLRTGPPTASQGSPFVVASPLSAGAMVRSAAGPCDSLDIADASATPAGVRFHYCDGDQPSYQLEFSKPLSMTAVDLSGKATVPLVVPATGAPAWRLTRSNGTLALSPQTAAITAVTDAAAFQSALSPGGLISIFGTGLMSGSAAPAVTLAGKTVPIVAAFPFQINAQIPGDTPAGPARLQVTSALGSATADLTISPLSPGIFVLGSGSGNALPPGAIVNQDGRINSPSVPAQRGEYVSVYAAGLGATVAKGGFQTVTSPISVVVNGASMAPSFAGLLPGFIGLYQVNVTVPPGLAPGLQGSLQLMEGGQVSNTVSFSLQ